MAIISNLIDVGESGKKKTIEPSNEFVGIVTLSQCEITVAKEVLDADI